MFHRKHNRVHPPIGGPSLTKQSMAPQCDINNILAQYKRTGVITHINARQAAFEDLPSEYDYQTSLNVLHQAEAAFAALPAKVRDSFGNSPQAFLEAFQDPAKADDLRALGLLVPKAPEAPQPAPKGD